MTLAALAGDDFSRSYLSLIELGRSRPSLAALSILATRLGLPISHFLDGSQGAEELARELALDQAEVAIAQLKAAEALRTLEGIDEPYHDSRFLYLKGRALTFNGQKREALPVLQRALEKLGDPRDSLLEIRIHHELSRAFYELGSVDEAVFQARKALSLAIESGQNESLLGILTVVLGHALYANGRFDDALSHYMRAREFFGAVNDLDSLASVYAGLSRIYQHRQDLQQAIRYSRMSVGIYDALQNQVNASRELDNMADRLIDLGKLDEALSFAQEAVERAQAIHAVAVEAHNRTTLASIMFERGDPKAAKVEAETALAAAGTDSPLVLADAWVVLGKVAESEGDTKASDGYYQQTLTLLKEHGHMTRYGDVALAYSLALQKRGETERALGFALFAAQERTQARR
jgi:tetratricopeptide (TPR) repeat protein